MDCRTSECFWDVTDTEAQNCRGYPSPATSSHPPAFDTVDAMPQRQIWGNMMRRQVAQRVLTLLHTARRRNLTRKNVEMGLANKQSTILKVTNICKLTYADETWNLRLKRTGHQWREKMRAEPAPQEQQDVEMRVEAPAESASIETWIGRWSQQRGTEPVCDPEQKATKSQKHDMQRARTPGQDEGQEPKRRQERENTRPLVDSSVATSVIVEDVKKMLLLPRVLEPDGPGWVQ